MAGNAALPFISQFFIVYSFPVHYRPFYTRLGWPGVSIDHVILPSPSHIRLVELYIASSTNIEGRFTKMFIGFSSF
jgi:hypothetical protein